MIVIIPIGLIVWLVRLCIQGCINECNKCAVKRRERQLRQQAEEYARQQSAPPTAPGQEDIVGQSTYNAPPPKYSPRAAPCGEKTPLMTDNA